ncbi:O-methyltransferase [Tumebacillus lipolyticus]|uniref:tRNA 5-hydroxyuridine methyltransferase n=1 Tax=Tumebacillus lipolyticus TaxID=1280370 RepID=A0ABW4ZV90_9BACL
MIDPTLVTYLRSLAPQREPLLQEIERRAEEGYIPILDLETVSLLQVLLKIAKPRRILELGTAIGYSAIVMGQACEAEITTLERDPVRAEEARTNFERAGLTERISLVEGDALELIESLGMFDFIFLDAAKGQYPKFLELIDPHLERGGVLLSDNILFQGMVSGQEQVKHKLRTMVGRLREYNELLAHHPGYETTFLPLGDGVSLSVKK